MALNPFRMPGGPGGTGRRPYFHPGPVYPPGYQPPADDCPYGGTAYSWQADSDIATLASQLGIPVATLLSYNPDLRPDSIVPSGQAICVPFTS